MRVATLSAAERVARQRDLGRVRKRGERSRKREAGRPDLNAIDRAIAETVRGAILHARPEPPMQRMIRVEDLVRIVGLRLLHRSAEVHEAGEEPLGYTREGVAQAIDARLFAPPKRPGKAA